MNIIDDKDRASLRMRCMELAVTNSRKVDIENPIPLADKYYEWVVKKSKISQQKSNIKP
jgi:hypothetical protein